MASKKSSAKSSKPIAFITDPHVHNHGRWGGALSGGLNRRCTATIEAIAHVVDLANLRQCSAIVVAGDIFDVSNPTPQIIAKLLEQINRFAGYWILIVGNHDMKSTQVGDHALGPLAYGHQVIVVERSQLVRHPITQEPLVYAVPFRPGPAMTWFPPEPDTQGVPIAMHLGCIDDLTPPFLQQSDDALPAQVVAGIAAKAGSSLVVAGNYHNFTQWEFDETTVVQLGTLAPKTIAEDGPAFGKVLLYDPGDRAVELKTVGGPRMIRARSLADLDDQLGQDWGVAVESIRLFVEFVHTGVDDLADVYERFKATLAAGRIVAYEVVEEAPTTTQIAGEVAEAIAESRSFEAALGLWMADQAKREAEKFPSDAVPEITSAIRGYLAGRSALEE